MKAAIRDKYGSPDVVEVREVERPTPKDDESSSACGLRRSTGPISTTSVPGRDSCA